MLKNLQGKKLILASKSPRRQALIAGLDIDFEIRLKEVEEIYPSDLAPELVPEFLAKLKAEPFLDSLEDSEILLTSDTIVILDGRIMEKPKSEDEAKRMLTELSGHTHVVVTGVCISSNEQQKVFANQTKVTFLELTEEEIAFYISKYKPFDKAGSYGAQEWLGYVAIEKLEGSFYSVMGLPLHQVYQALKEF